MAELISSDYSLLPWKAPRLYILLCTTDSMTQKVRDRRRVLKSFRLYLRSPFSLALSNTSSFTKSRMTLGLIYPSCAIFRLKILSLQGCNSAHLQNKGTGVVVMAKSMSFDFSNRSKLPETILPKAEKGHKWFLAVSQPHYKSYPTYWLKQQSLLSRDPVKAKGQLVVSLLCNNCHFATQNVRGGITASTDECWRLNPCTHSPKRAGRGEEGGRESAIPTQ